METINVVFATDEKYVPYVGTTLLSILSVKRSSNPICFYILEDQLTEISRLKLREIAEKRDASISFVTVTNDNFNRLSVRNHGSKVSFYRLAIPELLPHLNKVLYLDCDMLVRQDIIDLWQNDISNYHLGAVFDVGVKDSIKERFGLSAKQPYFNSGMMLINNQKWQKDNIGEKVLQYINDNESILVHNDQDALNAVLVDKWYPIHPKWNVYRIMFRRYYSFRRRRELQPAFLEAVANPGIVHFTGPKKPDHPACTVPYADEYCKYLSLTPWMIKRKTQINVFDLLSKYYQYSKIDLMNMLFHQNDDNR